jgi:hypothetical protein
MADGGLEKALTGKVGGVPVWGIGVGLAGLLIAFMVWRNHKQYKGEEDTSQTDSADGETTDQADPNDLVGSENQYPYGPIGQFLSDNPDNPAYPVGLPPQGTPGPITNQQWARLAGDYLIGKGNDPTVVQNALAHYINGQSLSAAEHAIIDLALTAFGSPPEGVLASPPTPPGNSLPAPTGLKSTGHTSTHVSLAWNAVQGANYYRVYSDKASGNIGASSTPTFTVTGLRHNTTYKFHVRAVGQDGNYGAASTTVSVKTSK